MSVPHQMQARLLLIEYTCLGYCVVAVLAAMRFSVGAVAASLLQGNQSVCVMGAGNGPGPPHWADPAGAGVQAGHCSQRGGAPAAACQQQAHA